MGKKAVIDPIKKHTDITQYTLLNNTNVSVLKNILVYQWHIY